MTNSIKKEALMPLLEDWNSWHHDLSTGIPREAYVVKLQQLLLSQQTVVITGARRSGKSFLLRQLAQKLIQQGVAKNRLLLVNCEDPRFGSFTTDTLDEIYQTYVAHLQPQDKPFIFLDEIQEVPGWEKWVRLMQELGKAQLILSGSNAHLLSRELATVLTGRHLTLEVWPLSFVEFLSFNQVATATARGALSAVETEAWLGRYFQFGGFPEVVLRENKLELLLTYFADILEKDLIKRYRIRKEEKLKSLARWYSSNSATLTTYSSVAKFLELTPDTVEKFSGYLENSYLFSFLKRFSFTVKQQEKSPRKVYAVDPGLAQAVGFSVSGNRGRQLENVVYVELLRRAQACPGQQLYYWKNDQHEEVDFVIKDGHQVQQLIQVVWSVADSTTWRREERSLLKGLHELHAPEGLVITADQERWPAVNDPRIRFMAIGDWLLLQNNN